MRKIASISNNVMSRLRRNIGWSRNTMVHAYLRKVVAFDLLFLGLGMAIGAGLATAFLTGDITKLLLRW